MTATGECRFCGQRSLVDIPDGLTEEEQKKAADDEATLECTCKAGSDHRADRYVMEQCHENIEQMFREKCPEVADLMQEAVPMVYRQQIKRVTVFTTGNGCATLSRSTGNLKLKFVQKNEMEMMAGY